MLSETTLVAVEDRLTLLLSPTSASPEATSTIELQQRAESGDAEAAEMLGSAYLLGDGISRDRNLAKHWLQRAARVGNLKAQAELGELYEGQVHQDHVFASDPSDTDPMSYRSTAESWLRRSADGGSPLGELWLADFLMRRPGSASDAEAVSWYRKAAELGKMSAEISLAQAYADGRGTARNPHEALRWYRAAAEDGNGEAVFHVGFAYEYGLGVEANLEEAQRWYLRASQNGDSDTKTRRPFDDIASLTLVSTATHGKPPTAILRDVRGKLRKVARGDALGTMHGKVESINEGSIDLIEVHPNGYGGWVEKTLRIVVK